MQGTRPGGHLQLADLVRLMHHAERLGADRSGSSDIGAPAQQRLQRWVATVDGQRAQANEPAVVRTPPVDATEKEIPSPDDGKATGSTVPVQRQKPLQSSVPVLVQADPPIDLSVETQRLLGHDVPLLTADDYGPLAPGKPPFDPLVPHTALWHRLRELLTPRREGALDTAKAANRLARLQWPRHWPRKARRSRHQKLLVLRDHSLRNLPFLQDYDHALSALARARVLPKADVLTFAVTQPPAASRLPNGVDAVLLLGDLGLNAGGAVLARRWLQAIDEWRKQQPAMLALLPLPAARVPADITARLRAVAWCEGSHLRPLSSGVRRLRDDRVCDPLAPVPEDLLGRLLCLLAPTQRVEPVLLRRLRRQAGPTVAPDVEAALWHLHPDCRGGEIAMHLRVEAVERWRQRFGHDLSATEQVLQWKTMSAIHRHAGRSTLYGEWLIWESCASDEARQLVGTPSLDDARDWFERLAHTESVHLREAGPRAEAAHQAYLKDFLGRNGLDARFGARQSALVARLGVAAGLGSAPAGVDALSWAAAQAIREPAQLDEPERICLSGVEPAVRWVRGKPGQPRGRGPVGRFRTVSLPMAEGDSLTLDDGRQLQVFRTDRIARDERWMAVLGEDRYGVFCTLRSGAVEQFLRYIEPGTFLMGSPEGIGHEDEHPQHPVTLSQGFWLADTPCTQVLWQAVMGKNPSHFKDAADAAERPVEQVNWDDVQTFLKRLNAQLPPNTEAFLATEAQWEYAARAGTATAYWWGNEPDSSRANWNGEHKGTTPVKRYAPNPWGLHDMHGNVWEWCAGSRRPYRDQAELDPPDGDDETWRALRGGSWRDHPGSARATYRRSIPRDDHWHSHGFRLALRSASPGGGAAAVGSRSEPAVSGRGAPVFEAGQKLVAGVSELAWRKLKDIVKGKP